MAKVSVYNMEGSVVGDIELNDAVFGVEVNEHLVKLAVTAQLANKRQGTQKAKTRAEVSGGGRKPWKQKGTGHARQGSTRSPQALYSHPFREITPSVLIRRKREPLLSPLSHQEFLIPSSSYLTSSSLMRSRQRNSLLS